MHCTNCGGPLPQEANACPSCGMVSPSFHSRAGSSADGWTTPTPAASSQTSKSPEDASLSPLPTQSETPVQQRPPTYPGSQPYYTHEPNPYSESASNPYSQGLLPYSTNTPPPPPSTPKPKNIAGFIVALCAVLLAALGTSIFVFAVRLSPPGTPQSTATPPQRDPQTLYSQMITTSPAMNDPLSGPDNYGWDNYTGQSGNTHCFFSQGQYHTIAQPGYFSPCYAKATNFQNFILQAKMTLISGNSGGLLFRADSTNDKGYQFRISMDGTYILNRIILDQQGKIQSDGETVTSGSSALVQKGTNQLAVIAQGDTFSLFINGKLVDTTTDSTYHSGQIGVYVDSDANPVEGAFSNLQVWKLA